MSEIKDQKHIVKVFTVAPGFTKMITNGQEMEAPTDVLNQNSGLKFRQGIYVVHNESFIYSGLCCLYQDGKFYDLNSLPENFTIYGDIDLSKQSFQSLPNLSTTTIMGKFDCSQNLDLMSLKGAPKAAKEFNASVCPRLTSLKYGPQRVRIYRINGNPQLKDLSDLPNELDYLDIQDGPVHFDIKNKTIKILNIGYCFRRTDLTDIPVNIDQVLYDHCANIDMNEIAKYNHRRREYLEKQMQLELDF